MNETLKQWWTAIQQVGNYPLFKIGAAPLTLNGLLTLFVFIVLVLVAERYLRKFLSQRVLAHTHLGSDLQYAVSRFVGYCFIAVGLFIALKAINLDLSALAVVIGALSVGIGFGLQNVVSNFVSGLIILAERPISIGHRVEVGGVAGQVTRINLRSTTVVTNDNITIIVPNSSFISQPVTNWSYGDPKVRLRLPLGVAYGTDIEKLQRLLCEVAAENISVLKEPAPTVRFLGFGDSALDFELAVWTIAMAHRPGRFRSDLYFAVERKLRENAIEIPFPQRDLHLRSGKLVIDHSDGGSAARVQ